MAVPWYRSPQSVFRYASAGTRLARSFTESCVVGPRMRVLWLLLPLPPLPTPVVSTSRRALLAAPAALVWDKSAQAAAELSDEQGLIVEAWAVVQRGYVDQQFGGNDWKATKSEYLKRKYKTMDEARAAVGEMLGRLGDRYTRYLSPGAYAALLAKYERPADHGGIGVTLRNLPGTAGAPGSIEIVSVVSGSPAASAGLRVGDMVDAIDSRALPSDATADDAAGMILGRLDSSLQLGVRRADGSLANFTLRRAVLPQGEVEARALTLPNTT